MKKRVLIGVGPKNHVRLAYDELEGLQSLGYKCKSVIYGRNNDSVGTLNKLLKVVLNAINVILKLYRFSPDILYLNSRIEPVACVRDFISLLLIKAFYFKKLKIVIKSHGSDLSVLIIKSFIYKNIILPFLINKVDKWFFLSKQEKEEIRQLNNALYNNIVVTVNIIDPKRSISSLKFKEKYSLAGDKIKLLYVGRMVNAKGIFNIMKSIPYLAFKNDCQFIFVGDGADFDELKRLSVKLNVSGYVHFLGFIPDSECDHFYANADVLVYPTFDSEGFPMALFKAVAAGLPIITTQIRAAKDYMQSPDNTLWVDGRSPESIAEAITVLYNDTQLRANMSKNNVKLGKNFSQKNVCLQMDKVFSIL